MSTQPSSNPLRDAHFQAHPRPGSSGTERTAPESEAAYSSPQEIERGRQAEAPQQIPARGWRDIFKRVKSELGEDNISMLAAGVAFFIWLGLMPMLAALISIYGLWANPADVERQLSLLAGIIPAEVQKLIGDQLKWISTQNQAAGWGAALGLILALWSGSKAMSAVIDALNIAYEEKEQRGYIKLTLTALAFTLGAVLVGAISIALVVALPAVLKFVGLAGEQKILLNLLRWPALALLSLFALACLYRFAPYRQKPKWKWVSWGAGAATLLWLLASALFSFYASRWGNYNKTYGSLGAITILLFWLYLSAYAVLLGAEINSEMELQTAKDTTSGPPKPMGERGAQVADNVAPSP